MKSIKERMRKSGTQYMFYNAKEDVRIISEYCNMLADKINELNLEVQELRKKVEE